jgi:hypothetical protein
MTQRLLRPASDLPAGIECSDDDEDEIAGRSESACLEGGG